MKNKPPLTTNLLRLSADKKQLLLLVTPVEDEVTVAALVALFQKSEYTSLKPNLKGLNKAVQCFTRLETQKERSADLESVMIAERIDAQLSISFGPLEMTAKALLTTAYGGFPITIEQLKDEMAALSITEGIIEKTLLLLVKKSEQAKPGSSFQASIAKGKQPIHGKDATFTRLVETPTERLLKPTRNEDGTVDMRNLGKLLTVSIGEHLMRKIPCIEGSDGLSVTGGIIPHTSGNDINLEVGDNTEISGEDELLLIATLAGIPKVINNGMAVDDVLLINDVNVGYGNVEYDGSVIIQGNICDGMSVKANGDITVSGFVESAQIECSGNLIVGEGIIGRKVDEAHDDYSCEVNCEGSVTANFSQYTKINSGLEVNIKKQLLHCIVHCEGDITVLDDTGSKGTILGGSLCSNAGVKTVTLGATAGSKTHIDLIGHYPLLMENKKQIYDTIHTEQEKLEKLISAQRKIDKLPNSEKKQMLDARMMLTKEQVKQQIGELTHDLDDNKGKIQTYFEKAKVVTQKEMFNDVTVAIGKDTFKSLRNYGPTKINVLDCKIQVKPFLK